MSLLSVRHVVVLFSNFLTIWSTHRPNSSFLLPIGVKKIIRGTYQPGRWIRKMCN